MQIEGIKLSTPDFTLKADTITGRQLWRTLERLVGSSQQPTASGPFAAAGTPGPGAVRRPSEEFAASGPALATDPASGFAAGGATQPQNLDARGATVLDRPWQSAPPKYSASTHAN